MEHVPNANAENTESLAITSPENVRAPQKASQEPPVTRYVCYASNSWSDTCRKYHTWPLYFKYIR